MTVKEVAALVGLSIAAVYSAITAGYLPARKWGRQWMIERPDALAWKENEKLHRRGNPDLLP